MMRDLGPGGARVSRALRKMRRILTALMVGQMPPTLAVALFWDALRPGTAAVMVGAIVGILAALGIAIWLAWAVEMDEGL